MEIEDQIAAKADEINKARQRMLCLMALSKVVGHCDSMKTLIESIYPTPFGMTSDEMVKCMSQAITAGLDLQIAAVKLELRNIAKSLAEIPDKPIADEILPLTPET